MKYYTKEHEWISFEEDTATIGITDHAQSELGDVVFVDLPNVGATFNEGDELVTIESVKAAGEILAHCACEIIAVNEDLQDDPALINRSPLEDGWIIRVRFAGRDELGTLLDENEYREYLEQL